MEFFENFTSSGISAIVIMCYLIGIAVKATKLNDKWIPIICGISGALLGVLTYFFIPELKSTNLFDTIALGIISGLSATGINQITKQLCGCSKKENIEK